MERNKIWTGRWKIGRKAAKENEGKRKRIDEEKQNRELERNKEIK